MPVLPCGRLYALKIEVMLLAGLEVIHIERADDLLSVDRVAGIDRSSRCSRCLSTRRISVGGKRSRRPDSGGYKMAPIETIRSGIIRHCADLSCWGARPCARTMLACVAFAIGHRSNNGRGSNCAMSALDMQCKMQCPLWAR